MTPTQKAAMEMAIEALADTWTEPGNVQYNNETLAIQALRAALAEQSDDKTYSYAKELAEALYRKHFSKDAHYASGRVVWEVLGDTLGVLTQIDNMVSTLERPEEQSVSEDKDVPESGFGNMAPLSDSFSLEEIADACIYAEIPDGQFQSVLIALHDNRRHGIKWG
jgi:hypothetical protein